eukprot:Blabericola_migrator_1__7165@NODE_3634_length_1619_cov_4_032861_g2253_i0_p3_GENE_NODE_3634_length_1619_cov_4_032861_g2253_i0NODE_3634_length_1619_cov_4_032861_g2253_i0_p3_ORF_typecomplete_len113_score4_16_NODE_3634_length_1619_cov_4_032861_g2253_i011001438
MQCSSSHQIYGAEPAKAAILFSPAITSVNNEPNPLEACVDPLSKCPDTISYIQRLDESDKSFVFSLHARPSRSTSLQSLPQARNDSANSLCRVCCCLQHWKQREARLPCRLL